MALIKYDTSLKFAFVNSLYQTPFYPINYARALAQMGHEPLSPYKSMTLFGKETYYYPNLISYMNFIYSVEGISGLFRGFGMKIISSTIGTVVFNHTLKVLDTPISQNEAQTDEEKGSGGQTFETLMEETMKEIICKSVAVVISHPFHVMALRCMAQFVGGETRYSSWNFIGNTVEIYSHEGIGGFFNGLIPRLLFEASTIFIMNSIACFIKKYIFQAKSQDPLTDIVASLIASSVTYPLSVVSTITAVNGCQLAVGMPPRTPLHASWIDVFKYLGQNNHRMRGSNVFFRTYIPPVGAVFKGFTLTQLPHDAPSDTVSKVQ